MHLNCWVSLSSPAEQSQWWYKTFPSFYRLQKMNSKDKFSILFRLQGPIPYSPVSVRIKKC